MVTLTFLSQFLLFLEINAFFLFVLRDHYCLISTCLVPNFHVFLMFFKNHCLHYGWIGTLNAFYSVLQGVVCDYIIEICL